ncbi:MAG: hypothetical protein Phog2KO_43750 [Phototrophicaceae bacterium]
MRRATLIVLFFLCISAVVAQDEGDISPDLALFLEQVEQETASLRDLTAQADVSLAFPTREEVIDFLDLQFETYYTEENIASDLAFYQGFGLIPADYDLVGEIANLYGEQVAGYYDSETEIMNVILSSGGSPTDTLPFLDRVIFAHEYVHALQDQYFDLDNFYADIEDDNNVDALLARQALIEGDATFVMTNYTVYLVENDPLSAVASLGLQLLSLGDISLPADIPHVLEQELTYPYFAGEIFVRAIYADGGWDAVNALYTDNPPLSTEHILHPERFLAGDMPITVSLADNSGALGDNWQTVKSGVLGEFYLRELLYTWGMSNTDYDTSADGWGGDSYIIYQDENDAYAYELKITWDNTDEAQEFYQQILSNFSEGDASSEDDRTATPCWVDDFALCILIEDTTTSISHAPTASSAMILLETD